MFSPVSRIFCRTPAWPCFAARWSAVLFSCAHSRIVTLALSLQNTNISILTLALQYEKKNPLDYFWVQQEDYKLCKFHCWELDSSDLTHANLLFMFTFLLTLLLCPSGLRRGVISRAVGLKHSMPPTVFYLVLEVVSTAHPDKILCHLQLSMFCCQVKCCLTWLTHMTSGTQGR